MRQFGDLFVLLVNWLDFVRILLLPSSLANLFLADLLDASIKNLYRSQFFEHLLVCACGSVIVGRLQSSEAEALFRRLQDQTC